MDQGVPKGEWERDGRGELGYRIRQWVGWMGKGWRELEMSGRVASGFGCRRGEVVVV